MSGVSGKFSQDLLNKPSVEMPSRSSNASEREDELVQSVYYCAHCMPTFGSNMVESSFSKNRAAGISSTKKKYVHD